MNVAHRPWRWLAFGGVVFGLVAASAAFAQRMSGTPAARAEVERGKKALEAKQGDQAVAAFRHAIELDPTCLEAHQQYVFAARWRSGEKPEAAVERLRQQYAQWIRESPSNAVLEYTVAQLEDDLDKQDAHYQRAVALDPKFAEAWEKLALDSDRRGDSRSRNDYARRAAEADPANPRYLFHYAWLLWETDPAAWTKLALQVVERFPKMEEAPQALYWLGYRAPTEAEKITYYERLQRTYQPETSRWSMYGAEELCRLYAGSQPDKSLAIARDMLRRFSDAAKISDAQLAHMGRTVWTQRVALEETVQRARGALAAGKPDEALALLESVKVTEGDDSTATRVTLLKVDAEAASPQPSRAYERLVGLVAVEPREPYVGALSRIAAAQKRSDAEIKADLRRRRDTLAKPAPDFTLTSYLSDSTFTLSSQKGKVVLLNFWYPS